MKRFAVLGLPLAAVLLVGLTACQPVQQSPEDSAEAELRAAGYARAPEVTSVTQQDRTFVVSGRASQNGRVRLIHYGTNASGQPVTTSIGETADGKGQFRAEVPSGPQGGLYDVLADDRGRLMHAEGKLFVPLGRPDKAVMLRAGGAAQPMSAEKLVIAVVDYDSGGGLAVAGQVAPQTMVDLAVDGVTIGQSQSDGDGRYYVTAQIPPPPDEVIGLTLQVSTDNQSQTRTLPVSRPQPGDRIVPLNPGWRVDWALPGGGMQTTIVY